jgi:tellurite resistance protein TehA-like permease
MAASKID